MASYIYVIENKRDGKCYVGRTYNVSSRWRGHVACVVSAKQGALYDAMRRDGLENFDIHAVDCCESTAEACLLERVWIHLRESNDPRFGYNDPRQHKVA